MVFARINNSVSLNTSFQTLNMGKSGWAGKPTTVVGENEFVLLSLARCHPFFFGPRGKISVTLDLDRYVRQDHLVG